VDMIETPGLLAAPIMVISYALEQRAPAWIAVFAFGCVLAALYALPIGSVPFLIAEGVWSLIALRRWSVARQHR
jgi:hypothetical protein